ncbi:MAG: cysteine methyltransferase [Desulfobulbus sp.]|nr:MAG: cysteine methyltransferase [Desulfobulbus sp.]
MDNRYKKIPSPIGPIFIVADTNSLRAITFEKNWPDELQKWKTISQGSNAIIQKTRNQLEEYFAGHRTFFELPIVFTGTPFQKKTWQALLTIPYGQTRSYSQQAQRVGNPKAVRAVGRTNGLNPIAIVVPCHRVIGKSGKLTGYAGGLDIKRFLLDLEKHRNSSAPPHLNSYRPHVMPKSWCDLNSYKKSSQRTD